jgi:DNA-binding response OmpR family regulator
MNYYAEGQLSGGAGSTPTILCIDDDPDISGVIERRLARFDVQVVRAFHGMHGFFEALKHTPDVIFMDLAMPNGDGATVLECLRRNRQTTGTPVIILTGNRDRTLKHRLFRLGANQVVHKPIEFDELLHTLSRYIDLVERVDEAQFSGEATC